ncbi:MAG: KR domain-containing protein, partial [Ilumatobacteraceae bacterium]
VVAAAAAADDAVHAPTVSVGARVFGLASGSLGSHVHSSAATLAPVPPHLSFEQAASCPTVFLTVDAPLVQLAAVRAGERLLLHAAAGGVGLAGLQVAAAARACVVATAGSASKRQLLRSSGVRHALSSRDVRFASEAALLGGAHASLNSLTSAGMVAGSLACLRVGGRFVEIGKRDVWSAARVAQERPDVAYSLLAVDFMPPAVLGASLSRLSASLASGALRPLPLATHGLGSASAALRQMSQARHVGKVVVRGEAAAAASSALSSGAVVITGGTGTLGAAAAAWAAEPGARRLVLLSRSGRATAAMASLLSPGSPAFRCLVTISACDASSAEDAAAALRSAGDRVGVLLHAGGVLADATLGKQSAGGLRAVCAPKAGALASLESSGLLGLQPCASQVLFSSVA